jgi:hypothetical protein
VWRVTLDYHLFPTESAESSRRFLSPISAHLGRVESNGQWGDLEVVASGCLVDDVHASWQWNAFMSGPTFTALTAPPAADGLNSARQTVVLESAANQIAGFGISHYYSGSWVAIATLTLNGDFARVGADLLSSNAGGGDDNEADPALVTPAPTPTPATPAPTPATPAPTPAAPAPATPAPAPATPAPTAPQPTPSACTSPAGPWQQCGGENWSGATCCSTGYYCETDQAAQGINRWYHQCRAGSTPPAPAPAPATPAPAPATPAPSPPPAAPAACTSPAGSWQQCGGQGWTGTTCCDVGLSCNVENRWYHQCQPVRKQRMIRGRHA